MYSWKKISNRWWLIASLNSCSHSVCLDHTSLELNLSIADSWHVHYSCEHPKSNRLLLIHCPQKVKRTFLWTWKTTSNLITILYFIKYLIFFFYMCRIYMVMWMFSLYTYNWCLLLYLPLWQSAVGWASVYGSLPNIRKFSTRFIQTRRHLMLLLSGRGKVMVLGCCHYGHSL